MTPKMQTIVDTKIKPKQSLYVIRHGDRWDYSFPEWKKTAKRPSDPSLSSLGHRQAREVGVYLDSIFSAEGINADNITVLASPFLRVIQTANEMLSEFRKTPGNVADTVRILPEYSVFEYDGKHKGKLHESLPTMEERKQYFPRLDENYQSMFVPTIPESTDEFFKRCQKAVDNLNDRFPFKENSAIVIVTHAAGCVALAAAAAGRDVSEMSSAGPCSIYRLNRSDNSTRWDTDHFSLEGGMNGYSGHISDTGITTTPWNHFGPKTDENPSGYTGPPEN
eukprot:CAMPEP_0197825278 /NCGR_PEP_ID=MMETSP1437-20131217/2382_1 /TAXON_ID=49252 ORGANISM="Eucampia antarctica, Strain CCMP1452" /NCGR_SAMPLE_ID=MMETSP1437 /ASSEMBLY_ACC=CAM_ASM_001096 /LENGTH=278 /DNA_ID=CAMNT_0043425207 /DNA_START=145 /DNA_END=981 /DNA_ORIENTATION=+